ncbi:uncharacterized protein LOC106779838 isoform X1 [Vigna radiata var. radiata]|uniref:Uncharacterized protein LOC106779838 isoform X1 n=1 Tax=Vigna radiata var. radiata TaxID=3916 RepID=A0A3Q0EKK9_VIGRR|nr:uncharacterized protein LOC106779838 isoform X1 [Vigna radiata var. radiata]
MHFFTAPSLSLLSPHLIPSLVAPLYFPGRTWQARRFGAEPGSVLHSSWRGTCYKGLCWSCTDFLRRCKDWGGEFSEPEILEFMQNSDKPEAFPTKEELVAARRVDFVKAIVNEGGWLAFGWELNGGSSGIGGLEDNCSYGIDGYATRLSSPSSSSQTSQTDDSVEIIADSESGIAGILNRLEKQRSRSFGLGVDSISSENNEDKDRTAMDAIATGLENSSRAPSFSPISSHPSGSQIKPDQHGSQLGMENSESSLKPEMWSWIDQRNGVADFEDAEIILSETQKGGMSDTSGQHDILKRREFRSKLTNNETGLYSLDGNASHNDIKSRIQHLESELSFTLHSLRSSSDKITKQMVQKSSSDDLAKLSDAWEFQENEILNAQDKLRSIQAKLAVLEGKMSLTIMDAHKVVEEKQTKISKAQKALQMLKTTCVAWPNNAKEIFLTGSFDGWSNKRKMERLSGGIFFVSLQLYPGRYEMKFIVDGEWKIDHLRPIVTNIGYENNLFIVSD